MRANALLRMISAYNRILSSSERSEERIEGCDLENSEQKLITP